VLPAPNYENKLSHSTPFATNTFFFFFFFFFSSSSSSSSFIIDELVLYSLDLA
jgi:hypothetical protein